MKYLSRAEAAEHVHAKGLPCTKGTLGKMATTGGGPVYRIFGNRALYLVEDLEAWIVGKMSAPRISTSGG